jgi:formate/nitrite transporter
MAKDIIHHMDALMPAEIARKAEDVGVAKAGQESVVILVLSILAGAFIAFGAVFATLVTSGSTLPYGITKLIGGLAFSLGLILVVVGGAELFTGNTLQTIAWASRKLSTRKMLVNWGIVYMGNMAGAFSVVLMIFLSGHYLFGGGITGGNILSIAHAKCQLGFVQAIILGILCNILVCLAIWLCYSARSAHGKILAILFPISAFVAAGFEHSVANMYFIPMGLLVKDFADPSLWTMAQISQDQFGYLTWANYLVHNLIPVTL